MFKNISRSAVMLIFAVLTLGFLASACILACVEVETSAMIMAICSCVTAVIGIITVGRFNKIPEQEAATEPEQSEENIETE